jgi:hypothetical protein
MALKGAILVERGFLEDSELVPLMNLSLMATLLNIIYIV